MCCDGDKRVFVSCCLPQLDNDRYISDEKALQIAVGNINVNTGERLADYDPDTAAKVAVLLCVTLLIIAKS